MTRRYLCDDRRMVLPELTKNGRALTRGVHQRMQECEAALFKDTSDEEMTVFLPVTLRATGQFVNAVQVSPVKHPSEGTVQSGRIFAGSPGQSASGGPGALTACEEGRGGMGTQCASGLAQPRSPAGRSRASGRPGSESISETGPGGHICPLSAMASVGPFSSLQPAPAPGPGGQALLTLQEEAHDPRSPDQIQVHPVDGRRTAGGHRSAPGPAPGHAGRAGLAHGPHRPRPRHGEPDPEPPRRGESGPLPGPAPDQGPEMATSDRHDADHLLPGRRPAA